MVGKGYSYVPLSVSKKVVSKKKKTSYFGIVKFFLFLIALPFWFMLWTFDNR